MTRDEARQILKDREVTPTGVTDGQLRDLRKAINKHLKASGIYNGTAKLTRADKDLKFMEMKTEQWRCREAVSFNRDGFIGVAGWADNNNVQPLLAALVEWSTTLKG